MDSLLGLQGKRILVIGGGQGMGEATALRLAEFGSDVALLDLEQDRAERVAVAVREQGRTAFAIAADVTDENSLVTAIATVEREFGPLDGMACIVGMAGWSPLIEMTTQIWDHDQNRNLRYFFVAAREVARNLLRRGASGSIVALSSVDGLRSAPGHAAYGAAKAGLINLVKSMAHEWSERGIRVNCVAPGPIVTPRLPLKSPEEERAGASAVPMRRRGTVDEIAKAVTFFLSDMSSFVAGQTLAVDGGYVAATGFNLRMDMVPGTTLGLPRASA